MENHTKDPVSHKADERRTRADTVRIRLTEEIVTGTLLPGARLDETSLAERFGVSRTPIREALRQLAASGLIESRPRQGAIVAQISIKEMVDLFEIMAELEGIAGRLAARRMTDSERKELDQLVKDFEPYAKKNDRDKHQIMNRQFHFSIYNGSHNKYLITQATALYNRLTPYRLYELNRSGEVLRNYIEHTRIVDAIINREADAAYHLLKEHTMLDADLLGDLMASICKP